MDTWFNNCDPNTNGELALFESIKHKLHVIFDVGCRIDSLYTSFLGCVHYFDPDGRFIDQLSQLSHHNIKSYYNKFGLGDHNKTSIYYKDDQSFICRQDIQEIDVFEIRRGDDYITKYQIPHIDFLKIDTEGYEFSVIMGFGNFIYNVDLIQFEYGGTYKNQPITLYNIIDYLKKYGFDRFALITSSHLIDIYTSASLSYASGISTTMQDMISEYAYCNILCIHSRISLTELFQTTYAV